MATTNLGSVIGPIGPQGIPGKDGKQGPRGYSGLVPKTNTHYAPEITVQANTMTDIAILSGAVTITLGDGVENYDNEWDFVIKQSETAQTVIMPTVNWGLGIAPTFAANTNTICRLYYIGNTLCGEWSVA